MSTGSLPKCLPDLEVEAQSRPLTYVEGPPSSPGASHRLQQQEARARSEQEDKARHRGHPIQELTT